MDKWIIGNTNFDADYINNGLAVSPWSGHRQFAYDLIRFLKPQRVVELGTHYGCSFFAFLQACKDDNLNSEIIAIDCWKGDIQAGFYGNEVWDTVCETLEKHFKRQNFKLIRKYFDDALNDIEDNSIDILHIDGLHTYEAVSNDYHKWLPKLKNDGVILFHDVASELGYGTNRFWNEITNKYSTYFFFRHSWGLGVLFPKGETVYRQLLAENMDDKVNIYEYRAMYLLDEIQLKDHRIMVEERDKEIKAMKDMIDERDKAIVSMTAMIDERDKALQKSEKMIRDRDNAIDSMKAMIDERDEALKNNEAMIIDRDHTIASEEALIVDKDMVISAAQSALAEKEKLIKTMEEMIADKDSAIASMESMIDDRDAAIKKMEFMIVDRDSAIKSMEHMINDRDELIAKMQELIHNQENSNGHQ